MPTSLRRHVAAVRACRRCPEVVGRPVIADPLPRAALLLVGQAPGPREEGRGRLFAHTAGQRLVRWLGELGVDEETARVGVWMSAVARCFPGPAPGGGDRPPSRQEIANCAPHLERELALLEPATVVPLGSLAIRWFLGPGALAERVGRRFEIQRAGRRLEVIPLPHPSGRSTWLNRPDNARRLRRALRLLGRSEGWRQTFGALAGAREET